jgi:hypothetical protein
MPEATTKSVYRYTVPLDDQWHTVHLDHSPLGAVEFDGGRALSFWAEDNGGPKLARRFRGFGTGHPVPDDARYWGTAPRKHGLVFHLYEAR